MLHYRIEKLSCILQNLTGKIIFNMGRSFYIFSTDDLPFQEKGCCINTKSTGPQV
jgi:hypothetical protein